VQALPGIDDAEDAEISKLHRDTTFARILISAASAGCRYKIQNRAHPKRRIIFPIKSNCTCNYLTLNQTPAAMPDRYLLKPIY
jgi:hypothetical protein